MGADRDPPEVVARAARESDLERLTDIMATSFYDDPTWGPLFGEGDQRRRVTATVFGFMTRSAIRYPWVLLTEGGEAASVWIPPGGDELDPTEYEPFEHLILNELGDGAGDVIEAFERFDEARPKEPPHFYLSLLGTHDDSRGRGIGMGLLAENLRRIDSLRMPAYLESTNPVNDARYERQGFERIDSFTVPTGVVVATMWREPR